jgi:hypothetical protein
MQTLYTEVFIIAMQLCSRRCSYAGVVREKAWLGGATNRGRQLTAAGYRGEKELAVLRMASCFSSISSSSSARTGFDK